MPPAPAGPPLFVIDLGGRNLKVEVASTPSERQVGLMHRRSLADDSGMLFLFASVHRGGFWMKNTRISLSIAYMTREGPGTYRIAAILDMEPCTADPCPQYDPQLPYEAALEVNKGRFATLGVAVGDALLTRGTLPTPVG